MKNKNIKAILIFLVILLSFSLITFYIYKKNIDKKFTLITHSPNQEEPNRNCDEEICSILLDNIKKSNKTIDFAVYGFAGQPEILEALKDARKRGVFVRGVVDKDIENKNYYKDTDSYIEEIRNIKTDYESDLQKAKNYKDFQDSKKCERPAGTSGPLSCFSSNSKSGFISVSQAAKEPIYFAGDIMHNKFFIFDQKTIWTGSTNISDTDAGGYNSNASLIINDKDIASWYKNEFEKMYISGLFHANKDQSTNNYTKNFPKGTKISAYFSPGDNVLDGTVLKLIKNAKKNVNVSIFYLTNKDVVSELIKTKDRGVEVRIIMDANGASNEYSKHEVLRTVGIKVKIENWGGKMHAKAATADNENIILGSTNWTAAGENSNDENLLYIENNKELVSSYNKWFENLWNKIPDDYLTKRPLPESVLSIHSCDDGIDNDYDTSIDSSDKDCEVGSIGYVIDPKPNVVSTEKPINKDECPASASIKGNIGENGHIFHTSSAEYYAKTDPEICFRTKEDAESAGFRQSLK